MSKVNTEADKLRGLSVDELGQQQRDQMDQLFRLKFQMKMGQTESLKKIRTLRRSVARLKTISRQHQLGIIGDAAPKAAPVARAEAKAAKAAKPAATTPAKASAEATSQAQGKTGAKKTAKAGKKQA